MKKSKLKYILLGRERTYTGGKYTITDYAFKTIYSDKAFRQRIRDLKNIKYGDTLIVEIIDTVGISYICYGSKESFKRELNLDIDTSTLIKDRHFEFQERYIDSYFTDTDIRGRLKTLADLVLTDTGMKCITIDKPRKEGDKAVLSFNPQKLGIGTFAETSIDSDMVNGPNQMVFFKSDRHKYANQRLRHTYFPLYITNMPGLMHEIVYGIIDHIDPDDAALMLLNIS
jgi:hypothetical protein